MGRASQKHGVVDGIVRSVGLLVTSVTGLLHVLADVGEPFEQVLGRIFVISHFRLDDLLDLSLLRFPLLVSFSMACIPLGGTLQEKAVRVSVKAALFVSAFAHKFRSPVGVNPIDNAHVELAIFLHGFDVVGDLVLHSDNAAELCAGQTLEGDLDLKSDYGRNFRPSRDRFDAVLKGHVGVGCGVSDGLVERVGITVVSLVAQEHAFLHDEAELQVGCDHRVLEDGPKGFGDGFRIHNV
mmetsp:Transcript_972/g.2533  ORF Transcript_972/g.2533 Transcript_972/m.2533 type:complete len:239 (-) Transcript_972:1197-1913(-)